MTHSTTGLKLTFNLIRLSQVFFFGMVVFLLLIPKVTQGLEVYSLVTNGYNTHTGLIVGADDEIVYLMNAEGNLVSLVRNEINLILVYHTLYPPFQQLNLTQEAKSFLNEVKTTSEGDPRFIAWPIRFIEDLIVFYDLKGKTHLVERDKIYRFTSPQVVLPQNKVLDTYKDIRFGTGKSLSECTKKDSGFDLQPIRIIADRIRINKFLSVYHQGFEELRKFKERTIFYSLPYLFEKETKFAFVYSKEPYIQELPHQVPFYLQWGSGKPYDSQGVYTVGSSPVPWLPNVEPIFGAKTNLKSHFLNASFAANGWAPSAGQDHIIKYRTGYTSFFSKRVDDPMMVLPSYNYLALTGIGIGAFSVSAGFYYPIFGIMGNNIFREILSERATPIVNVQYTTETIHFNMTAADTKLGSNEPDEQQIKLIYQDELNVNNAISNRSELLESSLESFDFHSRFLRLGFDYRIGKETKIGIDEVYFSGEYSETVSGTDFQMDFVHYITALHFDQAFSDYLSLKTYLNYFIRTYHSQSETKNEDTQENAFSFSVAIEFFI